MIHYIKGFLIGFIIVIILFIFKESYANRDIIREARINACEQAYFEYKDHIKQNGYHHKEQDLIIRCATYMTLVYAYESGYGQSPRCLNHFNCFGIKNMGFRKPLDGINTRIADNRFLIFDNYDDGNLVFARLYMYWNRNKNIETFVGDRSVTDNVTYIRFMRERYWDIYNELKRVN